VTVTLPRIDFSTMPTDSAHTSYWQTSEVVFGIPFLIAIVLQFLVPFSLPRGPIRLAFIVIGAALIIVGVALIVLARREFSQQSQPTDPGRPTTRVVTTGVFSISRNPIYLGAACFLAGVALAVSLVACHYVLIAPEERYLRSKFGEAYRIYAATVHRWMGRSRVSLRQPVK
jgi:protein-S-isoprenylcysteine O-methyltransferase Ste14